MADDTPNLFNDPDSLNGFTGFGKRDPRFQSAKEAQRKSQRQVQDWARDREREGRNFSAGPGSSGQLGGRGGLRDAGLGALSGGPQRGASAPGARDAADGFRPAPYREPFGSWNAATQSAARMRAGGAAATAAGKTAEFAGFSPDALARIPSIDRRWAWVEIDLEAIAANFRAIRSLVKPDVRVMAVVKADAYGHGALRCARTLLGAGAERLGIATIDEGIQLRVGGIRAPILLLEEPPLSAIPLLLAYAITPCIYTTEFAVAYGEIADAAGVRAPYHLAVNTGMNRIGVRHDDAVEFLEQVSFHRALDLEGTLTHFATADSSDTLEFQMQARRFMETLRTLKGAGIDPGIVHAANSAATVRYPEMHFDMVRPGIVLYGHHPCPQTAYRVELRPAMEVHGRISDVRSVPVSEGVGYGFGYRSPGSVRICTVPLGYGDGLRRMLSGKIDVLLGGRRCRQVGAICMDQFMFEVNLRSYVTTGRPDPHISDEVVIIGRQGDEMISLEEMAETAETITYELAIAFGTSRLPRLYR